MTNTRLQERLSEPATDTRSNSRNREQILGATIGTGNQSQERLSKPKQIPGATIGTGNKSQGRLLEPETDTSSDYRNREQIPGATIGTRHKSQG